jgi:hypothetical protein
MTETGKLYLTVGLSDGHITLDVGNHATQSYGKAKFRPFQCQEAIRWLRRFDEIDWQRVTLRSSCEHPDDHEMGDTFNVGHWLSALVTRMRSSEQDVREGVHDPREPMSADEQPTTKNGVVLCVDCKTRYTTSRDSFDSRNNNCPDCDGWKAMWLKDAE